MNDLKSGLIIELKEEPYQVITKEFTKMGKGKPVVVAKLNNLISGKVMKQTFQQADKIKEADVSKTKAQFLYKDADNFHFMDNESYEQFSLPKSSLGNKSSFLKEDTEVTILNFNEKPIDIVLPIKMNFKVISSPPGIKGDSAQSGNKRVEIETGLKIEVPLFIKEGDTIKINTEKGSYAERV